MILERLLDPESLAAIFLSVGLIADRSKNEALRKSAIAPVCYGAALLYTLRVFVHLGGL